MTTSKTPNIIQINVTANSGSTGRIVEEISRLVKNEEWNTTLFYGRKSNNSKFNAIKLNNQLQVLFHVFKSRIFDAHGLGSRRATQNLIKYLDENQPDLIHLHNIHGYYLNYPILFNYLKKINIPIVWTFHDCWPITGHCTFFESVNCDKWQSQCHECPQISEYPASFIDRSSKNYLRKKESFNNNHQIHLVTVSEWLKEKVANSFLKDMPCKVIYNGVNRTVFFPRENATFRKKHELEDKYIILGVANVWDKRKGLEHFIRLNKIKKNNWQIILIGLTPGQAIKIPSDIMVFPHTESIDELAEIYSESDVLFNPGKEESFGMVPAEAMACGTPVIGFHSSAIPEVVSENCGILLKNTSSDSIITAVRKIENVGKSHYSENCVKRIKDHFDKDSVFKKYIDLYKDLLNQAY